MYTSSLIISTYCHILNMNFHSLRADCYMYVAISCSAFSEYLTFLSVMFVHDLLLPWHSLFHSISFTFYLFCLHLSSLSGCIKKCHACICHILYLFNCMRSPIFFFFSLDAVCMLKISVVIAYPYYHDCTYFVAIIRFMGIVGYGVGGDTFRK